MIVHRPAAADNLADRAAVAFRAYLDGDEASMGDLIDLLTPILWHVARSQRLDASPAEDVVQTAWLRLVEHAQRVSDPQSVMKWLIVTVRRESWRVLKRAAGTESTGDETAFETGIRPPQLGPESVVMANDELKRLWSHVASLPERCQALLRVIAFADRPDYGAIAESLGMPVGSIGPTRGRCLAKLRAALERDEAWGGQWA